MTQEEIGSWAEIKGAAGRLVEYCRIRNRDPRAPLTMGGITETGQSGAILVEVKRMGRGDEGGGQDSED